jgi:FkbM family methyltransferase
MRNPMWIRMHRLFIVILTTKNWLSVLLVWLGYYQNILVVFRNNEKFKLERKNWVTYLERVYMYHYFPEARISDETVQFKYKNTDLVFDGGRYGWSTVLEIYGGQPYNEFFEKTKIKGKTVLDVGAAFGDTAILFLLSGAAQVIAVEAFPGYCRLAKKNVKNNGFESQCEVMLSAIGGHSGVMKIDKNLEEMFGIGVENNEIGDEVPIITIQEIVNDKKIKDAILKLDVEGFEYDIILNTSKVVLREFSDMVIEYHYGYQKIVSHLEEAGFVVSYTGPFHVNMPHLRDESARNMIVGNIYAKRIDY